jgi:hypothetical protein
MVSEATLIAKAVGVMIWDVRECGVGGYSDTVDGKQLVASICGRGERVAYRWGREKLIIDGCERNVVAPVDASLSPSFAVSHAYSVFYVCFLSTKPTRAVILLVFWVDKRLLIVLELLHRPFILLPTLSICYRYSWRDCTAVAVV